MRTKRGSAEFLISATALPFLFLSPLSHRRNNIDFAFEAKRAALGPHIMARWPWDEAFQRDLHEQHFAEKRFFEIRRAEKRLGTVSFQVLPDHVRFGEFSLFP